MSKLDLIRDLYRESSALADKTGRGRMSMFLDRMWARYRYGISREQFLRYQAFLYNGFARRTMIGMNTAQKFLDQVNNPDYRIFFEEKIEFNKRFASYINRKWLVCSEATFEQFQEFAQGLDRVVVKASNGQQGMQVELVSLQGADLEALYEKFKAPGLLLEECVANHPDLVFGNKSLNTLRVYTVVDRQGEVHVVKALIRAGVGDRFQDNMHMGGLVYPIDMETGRIHCMGYSGNGKRALLHPGSDIVMPGRLIPRFDEVKQFCARAAAEVKQVRYVGWDVAVTPSGIDMIEGNQAADVDMLGFGDDNMSTFVLVRSMI